MSALPPKADIGTILAEDARSPGPRSEVVIEVGASREDIQNARRIIGRGQGWIDRFRNGGKYSKG